MNVTFPSIRLTNVIHDTISSVYLAKAQNPSNKFCILVISLTSSNFTVVVVSRFIFWPECSSNSQFPGNYPPYHLKMAVYHIHLGDRGSCLLQNQTFVIGRQSSIQPRFSSRASVIILDYLEYYPILIIASLLSQYLSLSPLIGFYQVGVAGLTTFIPIQWEHVPCTFCCCSPFMG